jgi:hypothetical protein
MNTRLFVLPALCLGGAALLLAPLRSSLAFNKLGDFLNETQRDVRVFDNFLDSTADNNATPSSQFPGFTGLELALWKAVVEWGSQLHGTGGGDPINSNLLGDGGANFDAFWAGNAGGIGQPSHNIVSSMDDCGSTGVLAFTETGGVFGSWRIRFCDEWTWDDGPGSVQSRWDIQSVMAHEYGHALGLNHSTEPGNPTMTAGTSQGSTAFRSITADDIAGVQCIYGVASGTKPSIVCTVANAGASTLTVFGSNFAPTGNEVWFCASGTTGTSSDPIKRATGVSSSGGGTVLTCSFPLNSGPGDVIVLIPGGGNATVSNAFPTDLVGTFGTVPGPHPNITSVTPSSIDALIPGTAETITLGGTDLDLTTSVLLDNVAIDPSRYTIVDPNTITLDMPQASSLGAHNLGATDGIVTDQFAVTIVAPATPKLEWGTGDAANVVDRDNGLDMIVSGTPGALHAIRGSPIAPPTFNKYFRPIDMILVDAGYYVIPAQGWLAVHLENLPDPAVVGASWFAKSFELSQPKPFPASNDQSITLVP